MFYVHIFVFHIFTLRVHWAQRTKRKDELLCNKPVYRVSDQFVWVCVCMCVELLKWRRMKEVKWESIRHKLLSWSQSMELIYNVLMLSNISSIKNTMLRNTLGFYYYDATLIILCELNWIDATEYFKQREWVRFIFSFLKCSSSKREAEQAMDRERKE